MDNRKIIHVDMDAFFASVEQLDKPELKGKPVIVGGLSGRGVVSTCSYEARKYGIHSAMPMYMAKGLCPNGVFLPVRHQRYKEISDKIFSILYSVTDKIEPMSIDEAYLDVSEVYKDAVSIAKDIKSRVKSEIGLTISAGVSYNKFLAKLASDWKKPDGLMVITEDMVPDILRPLSVKKVYGIGEKTAKNLTQMGIKTIGDLLNLSIPQLTDIFGKYGIDIYNRIRGIDDRPITVERETKSIGKETTLKKDTDDKQLLKGLLREFAKTISRELHQKGLYAKTVTVKIKTAHFVTNTRSRTLNKNIRESDDIYEYGFDILKNIKLYDEIRLIGLSVSNLSDVVQLSIFDEEVQKDLKINEVIERINGKLGKNVLKKANNINQ